MKRIDFFFDFLSPFAHLAHAKLPELAQRHGYAIEYKPIDLPRAKKAAGNNGPSNREIPVKLRYLLTDMNRWAERYGVPLKMPGSLAAERMNKGTFMAIDQGRARDYVAAAFAHTWGRGGDIGDESVLSAVAAEMGWPAKAFLDYTLGEAAARRFEASNLEAHERGVFGVPAMLIGDEMWWGNDRLQFLEEFLTGAKVKHG